MHKTRKYIGIDLGASGGRVSIGLYEGEKIKVEEIHRFENRPVFLHGTLYWDFLRLFSELKIGIRKALRGNKHEIRSIGIDSWGIDFGLIDKNGALLSNPVCYRDERTKGILNEVSGIVSKKDLFMNTGEFTMEINTIFQLYYMVKIDSPLLKLTDRLLMIADLFNYFLTGEKFCEFTNAVTTQLYDQSNNRWSEDIMSKLKIPYRIFPEIIFPSEIVGKTTKFIDEEVGTTGLNLVATGSHDAASSRVGLPIDLTNSKKNWAVIMIGTWSGLGIGVNKPIINMKAYNLGFSNEGGVSGIFSFQKIIGGLWLIQECRDYWMRKENRDIPWDEISECARKEDSFKNYINVDDPIFTNKSKNMVDNIIVYYQKTGQSINSRKSSISRSIYEGLVFKYKKAIMDIESITGKKIELVYVTGGGSKNKVLCQWIAGALNVVVVTGIAETTTIGNILIQLIADGEINDVDEGRQIVFNSYNLEYFEPKGQDAWLTAFKNYLNILDKTKL